MSFLLEDNDYHDAILKSVDVDYQTATITLRIDAYEEHNGAKRSKVILKFDNVKSFNAISNLRDISSSKSFGNVNYVRSSHSDHFYIYLSNGALEIISERIEVTPETI